MKPVYLGSETLDHIDRPSMAASGNWLYWFNSRPI